MTNYEFQLSGEYHDESGIYDIGGVVDAPDALTAVDIFLHSVRERIGSDVVTTVVVVRCTVVIPESPNDFGQARTQGSGRGGGE